ncbi:MAG: hypothetical protein ACI4PX_00680 [Ruminococcus sp.]
MNTENLKKGNPDTQFKKGSRSAVEAGRKGGKASAISRNFVSALKKRLKDNPETMDKIIDSLVSQAENGDIKAVECLIDLNGESVQRESLKIKSKELKLKEKALQNSTPEPEKEEPLLYNALERDDS